ncbi:MAG: ABC transporter substrate-binding protein [Planctomycetes bacterium]|nr:ABC transporter substrate-binding protein [Planctomycetota bacterium]
MPPAAPKASYNLDIPTVEYRWDQGAGDKSVPPELGGPGFTGEGWQTNRKFLAMGWKEAPKGGAMIQYLPDWPATLRQTGKDWNTSVNYLIRDLCYESLLNIHPITLEHIPNLATHWWISPDKRTYRFRLNPAARWSDGKEVTAQDVVASFKLRMDPTLLDPSNIMTFGKLETPVALSRYMVEVKVKEENWRNFLYFAGASVFPAHQVSISGTEYLERYQFKFTASSGPYLVRDEDIEMGKSITIRRRKDWWDAANPAWAGLWNLDAIKFIIVKDENLAFEMVKKGEIDYFIIPKAQWWAEELDKVGAVKRGLLLKRKFFTDAPIGTSGIAINMKKPPLDDLRVRRGLGHLLDRKTLIQKLFFNEYQPLSSYYQGGLYQNPANVLAEYDELKAVELLEEAGWKEKNASGYRVKDGKELKFTLNYRTPLSERHLTVFQEACKRAGIRLELQYLTPAAGWKNLREKEFELMSTAWGALVFPNPETSFHSTLADQKDNNNVTGLKIPRVDALCDAYDQEYDVKKRIEIIREIDGLVFNEHPYILEWYLPCQRVVFWNKFGMPEWGGLRTHDYEALFYCWWVDPEKESRLEEARKNPRSFLEPKGEVENRFWEAWNAGQAAREKAGNQATSH